MEVTVAQNFETAHTEWATTTKVAKEHPDKKSKENTFALFPLKSLLL